MNLHNLKKFTNHILNAFTAFFSPRINLSIYTQGHYHTEQAKTLYKNNSDLHTENNWRIINKLTEKYESAAHVYRKKLRPIEKQIRLVQNSESSLTILTTAAYLDALLDDNLALTQLWDYYNKLWNIMDTNLLLNKKYIRQNITQFLSKFDNHFEAAQQLINLKTANNQLG